MDKTIYKLLLWACPVLLSALIIVAGFCADYALKVGRDTQYIKTKFEVMDIRIEYLDKRVTALEYKTVNK